MLNSYQLRSYQLSINGWCTMKTALVLCLLITIISAESTTDSNEINDLEWTLFKNRFHKFYKDENEEVFRKKVFVENKKRVHEHNKLYEKGQSTYNVELNHFADLMEHEFIAMMTGNKILKPKNHTGAVTLTASEENVVYPKSVNWTKRGSVTPVKNQGLCGACWAFSAVGAIEAQEFIRTKKLVTLSEQNLIDCSFKYGNNGCNGGYMGYAFQYIMKNKGINTEKTYPYKGRKMKCQYNSNDIGATVQNYVEIPESDENALMKAVATVGPVSVGIDVSGNFPFYSEGVYYNPDWSVNNINHAVLVVGYGTDEKDGDYWIVKNSWGTSFGNEGYILMARNKGNNCGIATMAVYPLVSIRSVSTGVLGRGVQYGTVSL